MGQSWFEQNAPKGQSWFEANKRKSPEDQEAETEALRQKVPGQHMLAPPSQEPASVAGWLKNLASNTGDVVSNMGSAILPMLNPMEPAKQANTGMNLIQAMAQAPKQMYQDARAHGLAPKYMDASASGRAPVSGAAEVGRNVKNEFYNRPLDTLMDASLVVPVAGEAMKGIGVTNEMARLARTGAEISKWGQRLDPFASGMEAVASSFKPISREAQDIAKANKEFGLGLSPAEVSDRAVAAPFRGAQHITDSVSVLGRRAARKATEKADAVIPKAKQKIGGEIQSAIRNDANTLTSRIDRDNYAPIDREASPQLVDVSHTEPPLIPRGRQTGQPGSAGASPGRGDEALNRQVAELGDAQSSLVPRRIFEPTASEVRQGDQLGNISNVLPDSVMHEWDVVTQTFERPGMEVDTRPYKQFVRSLNDRIGRVRGTIDKGPAGQLLSMLDKAMDLPEKLSWHEAQLLKSSLASELRKNPGLLKNAFEGAQNASRGMFSQALHEAAQGRGVGDEFAKAEQVHGENAQSLRNKETKGVLTSRPEKVLDRIAPTNPTARDAVEDIFRRFGSEVGSPESVNIHNTERRRQGLEGALRKVEEQRARSAVGTPNFNLKQVGAETLGFPSIAKYLGLNPGPVAKGAVAADIASGLYSKGIRSQLAHYILMEMEKEAARKGAWAGSQVADRVGR